MNPEDLPIPDLSEQTGVVESRLAALFLELPGSPARYVRGKLVARLDETKRFLREHGVAYRMSAKDAGDDDETEDADDGDNDDDRSDGKFKGLSAEDIKRLKKKRR